MFQQRPLSSGSMKKKQISEIIRSGEKIMSDETYKELREKFIKEI